MLLEKERDMFVRGIEEGDIRVRSKKEKEKRKTKTREKKKGCGKISLCKRGNERVGLGLDGVVYVCKRGMSVGRCKCVHARI
jgi:hypothetical protein